MAHEPGTLHGRPAATLSPWYRRYWDPLLMAALAVVFLGAALVGGSELAGSGAFIFGGIALLRAIEIWRRERRGEPARDAWERAVDQAADRVALYVTLAGLLALIIYDMFAGNERDWPYGVLILMLAGYVAGRLYYQSRVN
jgi:hypothetical protein